MELTPERERTLRPLGIGEVLDRAVTLCVRFFIPLAVVYVVFAIPQGIVQFFASRGFTRLISVFTAAVQTQVATGRPADPAKLAHQLAGSPVPSGWLGLAWVLIFVVAPLAAAALVEMTAADYLGRPSSFAAAYRTALHCWLPLIGVNLLFALAGIFLYFAFALVVVLLGLGIGFLYVFSHPLGLAVGIPFALVLLLAVIAFAVIATLALQVSYFTCVIERASPVRAFSTSISRVFGAIGLPRALLFGAAYLAILLGIGLVALIGEVTVTGLLHSDVAAVTYSTLLRIVTAIFTTAFVCIFYFDLRVREEGYDLQLAAQDVLR
jgi:hypothetical protein